MLDPVKGSQLREAEEAQALQWLGARRECSQVGEVTQP